MTDALQCTAEEIEFIAFLRMNKISIVEASKRVIDHD
jgi:hypothetical protein